MLCIYLLVWFPDPSISSGGEREVSVVNNQQLAYIHGISISQTLTSELEHYS